MPARIFSLAEKATDNVFARRALPLSVVIAIIFAISGATVSATALLALAQPPNALSLIVLVSGRSQGLVTIAHVP